MSSAEGPQAHREWVVATSNPGKLREIRAILAAAPVVLRALDANEGVRFPPEGEDYAENAIAKARAVASATGRPAVADDSGLEVTGLGGKPGPRSARYGGAGLDDAGRVTALLAAMSGLAGEARDARFVCVAALATPEGDVLTARGECAGRILGSPQGGGGFGYDPVFQAEEGLGRSMAELSDAEKHAISHRGRAFRMLWLRAAGTEGDPSANGSAIPV
jgi:XTP/dITP diphosphohydrolase